MQKLYQTPQSVSESALGWPYIPLGHIPPTGGWVLVRGMAVFWSFRATGRRPEQGGPEMPELFDTDRTMKMPPVMATDGMLHTFRGRSVAVML